MSLLGELPVCPVELCLQNGLLLPQELLQLLERVPQPLPLRGHGPLRGTRMDVPEPPHWCRETVLQSGVKDHGEKGRDFGEEKLEEWRGKKGGKPGC